MKMLSLVFILALAACGGGNQQIVAVPPTPPIGASLFTVSPSSIAMQTGQSVSVKVLNATAPISVGDINCVVPSPPPGTVTATEAVAVTWNEFTPAQGITIVAYNAGVCTFPVTDAAVHSAQVTVTVTGVGLGNPIPVATP